MQPIIEHLQNNQAAYIVGAVVILPLIYVFRAKTMPFLYHTTEYIIYCGLFHALFGGIVRFLGWFREETTFNALNPNGKSYAPVTTPFNLNFWQRDLYNPEWLAYIELGAAVVLLWVVIKLRPTRFKRNVYKKQKKAAPKKKQAEQFGGQGTASNSAAAQARLERLRGSRS